MTNQEVIDNYSTESWVMEELLSMMLIEFREKVLDGLNRDQLIAARNAINRVNTVGFVKDWIKNETLVNTHFAEKSKMENVQSNVVTDAEFREV